MSEDPRQDVGTVRPTPPGVLVGWGLAGLVGGWLVRPVARRLADSSPVVTWPQVLALFLVAAILAGTAWITWRTVAQRRYLESHQAVNRLVLAKACALVGALVAGGYAGYGVSWLGLEAELAGQRMLRSGLGSLGGLLTCGAALLLERACRVRDGADDA
ncbi:DUF3180 domain-containing protein [Nocardioides donggukensis]|uniref:DUF3180 domain-containing protein n=1 Tax=Nocardioides donggukensis TaxID=2774019 RepID=A0A927K6Q1_9ACTN|nr:DUF3180 domain-containing protein [Nocardioides donggukensis]MBD8870873.1 DUF3180 domain-containing protein [Nocardioides donggukensis]